MRDTGTSKKKAKRKQRENSPNLSIIGLVRLHDNIDVNGRITEATGSGIDISVFASHLMVSPK